MSGTDSSGMLRTDHAAGYWPDGRAELRPDPKAGPGWNRGPGHESDHESDHVSSTTTPDGMTTTRSKRPGGKQSHGASLGLFLRFLLRTAWRPVLVASVLGVGSGVGSAMLISLINESIRQSSSASAVGFFVLLLIATLATLLVSQYVLISLSQNTIARLRLNMAQGILASRLNHLERLGEHRLLATLISDVRSLSHSFAVLPGLVADSARIVSCLAYLAWLSGSAFVLLVVPVGGTVVCVRALMNRAHQNFALAREQEDRLFEHFGSIIRGIKELKLSRERRDDFVANDLQPSITMLRASLTRAMKLFAWSEAAGQLALLSILGCLVFFLPSMLNTDAATIASFALTILFLTGPFLSLLRRLPDLARGSISLHKIDSLELSLSSDVEPLQSSTSLPELETRCVVRFEHLMYHYPAESRDVGFCLGPVSLELQPGTITFLTGGNGSGKSTIAKLVSGLYEPDSGRIRLNGQLITDDYLDWYREHLAVVFSDFHLFRRCLGAGVRDEDIADYLRLLQLDGKVTIDQGRLSTTRLSSGQRKRLALLAACLDDRPVQVFDEWASDQDPAFRDRFYRQILPRLRQQGKTLLVITHDDRYFELADQLLTLDYGQLRTRSGGDS